MKDARFTVLHIPYSRANASILADSGRIYLHISKQYSYIVTS